MPGCARRSPSGKPTETAWLCDTPPKPLQQTLKDLERAYTNFFAKRADFPRFKKKGRPATASATPSRAIKLDQANSRLFLPKLGWIRYRNSRDMLGTAKNITVSSNGGKWFVSIQTEREVEQPVHPATAIVGIDVGIARFATLSDGSQFRAAQQLQETPNTTCPLPAGHESQNQVQQQLEEGQSQSPEASIPKIANVRRDFLHKTTTTISQNHAIVCIEDLQVRNMSKSAAGSSEAPGRNVRPKSGLNKSILDQGWVEFRRQLEYKQAWRGGEVIAVPAQNTSRTCPCCGHVVGREPPDASPVRAVSIAASRKMPIWSARSMF